MVLKLLIAVLFTILPITELRVGLPIAISYALENHINVFLIFTLIVLINILVVFFVFWFLDNLHNLFMKIKIYRKLFEKYLEKFQRKVNKYEKNHYASIVLGLMLFVAVPLPGTGAWTGCLLSWLLELDRKKSILGISLGVLIAGIVILIGSLGIFSLF